MTDNEDDKTISVAGKKTLSLKPSGVQQGTVRQDMGRGRTKAVVVETRTKRHFSRPGEERQASTPVAPVQRQPEPQQTRPAPQPSRPPSVLPSPRSHLASSRRSGGLHPRMHRPHKAKRASPIELTRLNSQSR